MSMAPGLGGVFMSHFLLPLFAVFFFCLLIALGRFALSVSGANANANADAENIRETLDELLPRFREIYDVPGMAAGVIKDGKIIYAKGFGLRKLGGTEPETPRSLFHMASVSKPFAATAVMQLVEQGKIKLTGKLTEYLPYFKLADPRYKDITIQQMLSHTSGISDVEDYQWDKPQYDEGAAERFIRSLAPEELLFKPGERHSYSNKAFDILADVVARTSGKTFEAYVKDHIFKPLGMKDSTFLKKEVPAELENAPHLVKDIRSYRPAVSEIYPYNRRHAPSSTLHSNVTDMLRWAMANMNGGVLEGKRVLKAETHANMLIPRARFPQFYGNTGIGLGWFLGEHRGETRIGHGGSDVGFRAQLFMLPEKSMAVVTMGNSASFDPLPAAGAILDVLLGHKPPAPQFPIDAPIGRAIGEKGIESAIRLYHSLKKENGPQYLFDEYGLDDLGHQLMSEKRMEEALEIFKLNVAEYPGSWRVYDSLAECCDTVGDKADALKYYQLALKKNTKKDPGGMGAAKTQEKIIEELKKK